jgi:cell division protein FtsL
MKIFLNWFLEKLISDKALKMFVSLIFASIVLITSVLGSILYHEKQIIRDNKRLIVDNKELISNNKKLISDNKRLISDNKKLFSDNKRLILENSKRNNIIEMSLQKDIEFEIHNRSVKKEIASKGGRSVNPSSQKRWKTICFIYLKDNNPILNKFTFDGKRTLRESCSILVSD